MEHKWYVVHTYSGYENRVETDALGARAQNNAEALFSEILVPQGEKRLKASSVGRLASSFPGLHLCEDGAEYRSLGTS